jgi:FtsP/CotA-like multicopper oxidase with cupredoxin domain
MDKDALRLNRRDLLKLGGAALVGSVANLRADPVSAAVTTACSGAGAIEVYPTTPLILSPFTDPLPVLAPLAPVPMSEVLKWTFQPGPGVGQQDSSGNTHQLWPTQLGLPDPRQTGLIYLLKVQVAEHRFTTSLVQPIGPDGRPVIPPGTRNANPRPLPGSTVYGFNARDRQLRGEAVFPGPMIYARYGFPNLVRFENHLDENPLSLDRNDFGDPGLGFLTHLHNGHTASESDGNPHWRPDGYHPKEWVDNLYLNIPAGGDPDEKMSFLWFHDHFEGHTGANVYKGMVGIYPVYDPVLDRGDERINDGVNLRLPGVPNATTGRVDYDIPLAVYDCALDDGVTQHQDFHNGCGETHPEWWGKTYFRHFPNHGFVGDLFTINGVAFPVLHVDRRKYRLRFLDASVSRVYEFMLMSSTSKPVAAPGTQGQYQLPDGQQCMRFTQIASEGGLLPFPVVRNSFQIWPAKRREFIVDFSKYLDGTPTTKGDEIYLVNLTDMSNGRGPDSSTGSRAPMMKIVIGDLAPDNSVIPSVLRPLPVIDTRNRRQRTFELQRGGFGGEIEWLINGLPFQLGNPLAFVTRGVPEVWTVRNGGGGWVHPMHFHQEEHQILTRNRVPTPGARPTGVVPSTIDDFGKEDTIALGPGDEVVVYRNFRTFPASGLPRAPYVAHCHNLAHEDHNMMFGWTILKP